MLVYANHLALQGKGSRTALFKAIGAWLKEQLGYGLRPEQVRENGEYRGKRDGVPAWLKIHVTNEEEPELYAWSLRVTDNSVRGRQWITELGLKIIGDEFEVSCILRTDEQSVLVTDTIMPSQPRVIRYIVDNINKTSDAGFCPGTLPRFFAHHAGRPEIKLGGGGADCKPLHVMTMVWGDSVDYRA